MELIKEILINADDFALKSSVNNAIVELFNKRLINSTTLMTNMHGFDEAV
jgi:chitin disaccharide deacetylase